MATEETATAIDHIRTALSQNADFQTWVGEAGNAANALTHIHKGSHMAEITTSLRPIVVLLRGGVTHHRIGVDSYIPNGTLGIYVEADISSVNQTAAKEGEAHDEGWDKFEELLDLIRTAAGTAVGSKYIELGNYTEKTPLGFPEIGEVEDNTKPFPFWRAEGAFEFGPRV